MLTKHYSDCMSLQMMLSFCDISISNGTASTSGIRAGGGMLLPQARYKIMYFIKNANFISGIWAVCGGC